VVFKFDEKVWFALATRLRVAGDPSITMAQKKRRMLSIVVSRFSAIFQRLMLLDYQIGLDFASGVGS
jgi:hypothetical protein